MTLWRRILVEKRVLIIPLAFAIATNIALYVLVVHPKEVRSANAAGRAVAAQSALRAAEKDLENARALVTGKSRAEQELSTFYDEVLPADLTAARHLTYAALPALAKKSNVTYQQSRYDPEKVEEKDVHLGRLHIRVVLAGDYEGFRRFIYEFESSPEFVILDDFTILQSDPTRPLTLTLELSTYYRLGEHGN
jgi:Tfp pilus assembly protein PilO